MQLSVGRAYPSLQSSEVHVEAGQSLEFFNFKV